jgi:hypothetical protein
VERWNGASWAIQSTPNPAGTTFPQLQGVSCTSPSACTAVGYDDESSGQLVTLGERWNGTSWATQSTANPTGATSSQLQGVSCPAVSACAAVGDDLNSSGHLVTLAERWNGATWAIQSTPNPSGATSSQLQGVSCTSATVCAAVGYDTNSGGHVVTLAERWNGTSWAIQSTPNPSGATYPQLQGVSCSAASACTAVGYDTTSSQEQVTLAERWNGTSWTIQATANPTGTAGSSLSGVSCASATACTTVGDNAIDYENQVLAERWNGTSWTIQPTPSPSVDSSLFGVSCASATACTAIGSDLGPAGVSIPLAEAYSG